MHWTRFAEGVRRALPLLIGLATAALAGSAGAQVPGAGVVPRPTGSSLVRFSIEPAAIVAPRGSASTVVASFVISPKWHLYWRNPGDSGVAPRLRWTAPKGVTVGEPMWPRPRIFAGEHETTFGYEGEVGLVVPITLAPDLPSGKIELRCEATWMVCQEACLLGSGEATVTIEVEPAGEASFPPAAVRRWLPTLPAPPSAVPDLEVRVAADRLEVTGPCRRYSSVAFLPYDSPGIDFEGVGPFTGTIESGRFRLEVRFSTRPNDGGGEATRLAGLLIWGDSPLDPSAEIEENIRSPSTATAAPTSSPDPRP